MLGDTALFLRCTAIRSAGPGAGYSNPNGHSVPAASTKHHLIGSSYSNKG